jgi:hypothetical protein
VGSAKNADFAIAAELLYFLGQLVKTIFFQDEVWVEYFRRVPNSIELPYVWSHNLHGACGQYHIFTMEVKIWPLFFTFSYVFDLRNESFGASLNLDGLVVSIENLFIVSHIDII